MGKAGAAPGIRSHLSRRRHYSSADSCFLICEMGARCSQPAMSLRLPVGGVGDHPTERGEAGVSCRRRRGPARRVRLRRLHAGATRLSSHSRGPCFSAGTRARCLTYLCLSFLISKVGIIIIIILSYDRLYTLYIV